VLLYCRIVNDTANDHPHGLKTTTEAEHQHLWQNRTVLAAGVELPSFESVLGATFVTVQQGEEALELLNGMEFHLLLIGRALTDISPWDLGEMVARRWPAQPWMFIAPDATPYEQAMARRLGCHAMLDRFPALSTYRAPDRQINHHTRWSTCRPRGRPPPLDGSRELIRPPPPTLGDSS
jgi:hypothetical protein